MPRGYDDPRRYREPRRYDEFRDPRWQMMPPVPWGGWYPGVFWGVGPSVGWGDWGWFPGASIPVGYGDDFRRPPRRRPPQESPAYGRGADRELQRWARRYGYDLEYEIRPRQRQERAEPEIVTGWGRVERPSASARPLPPGRRSRR